MTGNGARSGTTKLVQAVVETVRSLLPTAWSVTLDLRQAPDVSRRDYQPDGRLTIVAPGGERAVVLIECKGVVVPRDVASVANQLDGYASDDARSVSKIGGAVLAAPFISPTTRAQLDQRGLGWFDMTGNLRLRLDRPAVFLDRVGADRGGFRDPADRLLKSLRGPAAAKVVLELCEASTPIGVRDLAERAQVSVATSARVLELLDREAAIVRNEDGVVAVVRKRSLIDRWTQDYKVMSSNEVMTALDPRGLSHALNALTSAGDRVVVTGSAAARAYLPEGVTPVSPIVSLNLYAEDPIRVMEQMGLKTVDRGTNVLVMRPYDEVVYAKSRVVDGIRLAAPAQVAADLLTGPGRSSEEAEQLMAVLAAGEPGWER